MATLSCADPPPPETSDAELWRLIAVNDHAAFTAPLVPHKALVRMRLAGEGDLYIPVPNPLHA